MEDGLSDANQEAPDQLIKTVFPVKVETATMSGIKSRFGIMVFSTSNTILDLWVFSLTPQILS